jgi:AI-2 transport protein TqsA
MEKKYNNSKFITIVASLFLITLTVFILKTLQDILLPFFIAIIIALMFEPLYAWLKNKKLPGWAAIIVIVLIIVIIANISSIFIVATINPFQAALPSYEQKFNELFNNMFYMLGGWGIDTEGLRASLDPDKYIQDGTIAGIVTGLFSSLLGILGDFVFILIYVVFLLSEFGSIKQRIMVAFSSERAGKISSLISDIFRDVRKYIIGLTLINLIHAIFVTIILWAFGVDFYLIWGLLTFLLDYIPNIGAIISTVLPFLTALMVYDNIITPLIILIILIVIGNVVGNLIEPKVFGDSLDLSPVLILFALIFWGYVWGIMGMILSVPIISMIKIVLMKFDTTRPIAVLMTYNMGSVRKIRKRRSRKITEQDLTKE